MPEIEIIIDEKGRLLVNRSGAHHNDCIRQLLPDVMDKSHLENFLLMSENSERIFGNIPLCG